MMYTTRQVADILVLSPDTVRAMILTGRLGGQNIAPQCARPQYRITGEQLATFQAKTTILKAAPIGRPRRHRRSA